jgi:hypothetical protein
MIIRGALVRAGSSPPRLAAGLGPGSVPAGGTAFRLKAVGVYTRIAARRRWRLARPIAVPWADLSALW